MRFWLGSFMQLKKKDILRNLRLRGTRDIIRRRLRYDSGFMVPGSDDIRTVDRKGSILSHQPQIDNEEDPQR